MANQQSETKTMNTARINPMLKPAFHRLGPDAWLVTETAKAGGLWQVRRRINGGQVRYTCTCPDHRHRHRDCRHIMAVMER